MMYQKLMNDYKILKKQASWLEYSYNECREIGIKQEYSIEELAQIIQKIVGYSGELYFDSSKPDGTMVKLTDPSKLHDLGWKHTIELEDGIKRVYEWYTKDLNV